MPKYKYRTFKQYWDDLSMAEHVLLWKLSGLSRDHLYRIVHGKRMAGAGAIAALNKVDKTITARLLRPDLHGKRVYFPRKTSKGPVYRNPSR